MAIRRPGPRRDGISPDVTPVLPAKPVILWRRKMTGWGLSGVAASSR